MMRFLASSCLFLCFWIFMTSETARGDVIIEGTRGIGHTFSVDFGQWNDQMPRQVTIEKGDTFSHLALEHLGNAGRAGEIAASNPGVDPRRLKVGSKLIIPARVRPQPGREPLAFYGLTVMHGGLHRIFPGETYGPGRYGHYILAVEAKRSAEFEKLFKQDEQLRNRLGGAGGESPGWIYSTSILSFRSNVNEHDPIHRMHTTLEVIGHDHGEGRLHWKYKKVERFGEDGKIIAAADLPGSNRTLFAGLCALGLIGLFPLARMRRRKDPV